MDGTKHEIKFWKEFVKTERFLKGWCSNTKTPELNIDAYEFIKKQNPARVLDVGSGVVSLLTGTVPNECLIATDLLANEYAKFFKYSKYDVVQPLPYAAEDLPYLQSFDLVHISNALDHTQNPVKAYTSLLNAVSPGGYLMIQGFENEGYHENWEGLHQWNLRVAGTQLFLENRDGPVTSWVGDETIKIYTPHMKKYWFIYIKQKKYEENILPAASGEE